MSFWPATLSCAGRSASHTAQDRDPDGEKVSPTKHGIQTMTLNRNASNLFAGKWLRTPATSNDEGLEDGFPPSPVAFPGGTTEGAAPTSRRCQQPEGPRGCAKSLET
jgi:hypothetical protein